MAEITVMGTRVRWKVSISPRISDKQDNSPVKFRFELGLPTGPDGLLLPILTGSGIYVLGQELTPEWGTLRNDGYRWRTYVGRAPSFGDAKNAAAQMVQRYIQEIEDIIWQNSIISANPV